VADRYLQLANSRLAGRLVSRVGLPRPAALRRAAPGEPALVGPALVGAAPGGRLGDAPARWITEAGGRPRHADDGDPATRYGALVFDATGIAGSAELAGLRAFFGPVIRRVAANGRVLVLGLPWQDRKDPKAAAAQRALEGFVRSVGKEAGRGITANLVRIDDGAQDAAASTVRFLLSARSAFVSGQVVPVGALPEGLTPGSGAPGSGSGHPAVGPAGAPGRPLAGRVAVVTGAARGIGETIAATLHRDGAELVVVDVPAAGEALTAVAGRLSGTAVQLDITAADAPQRLAEHLRVRHGGADIVVHNAGITRDRTLGRMTEQEWDSVLAVNLTAQERITDQLLDERLLRPAGRIVAVSSQSGIAGGAGQTNYASSKAGIIGMVAAMAPVLAGLGGTINAVAPGFIETAMTAAMPVLLREAGRRLSSLMQGGLPIDVAETISWLAEPGSGGINGAVIRVDGQGFLGA
jgi:3-oxoacyl-[acyl-carrier protein] reductase